MDLLREGDHLSDLSNFVFQQADCTGLVEFEVDENLTVDGQILRSSISSIAGGLHDCGFLRL
jgi:hypothetical protein